MTEVHSLQILSLD